MDVDDKLPLADREDWDYVVENHPELWRAKNSRKILEEEKGTLSRLWRTSRIGCFTSTIRRMPGCFSACEARARHEGEVAAEKCTVWKGSW